MALGFRVETNALSALAAVALLVVFTLAVSWIAVLVGVLVGEPDKVQVFGFVVIFPLTFVSNAFVPMGTMPGWLQAWVKVNPVTSLARSRRLSRKAPAAISTPSVATLVPVLAKVPVS